MEKQITKKEEDYLKGLMYLVWQSPSSKIGTNQLADAVGVTPATANSMLKKLKEKDWVNYKKYGSLSLTDEGKQIAIYLIRKHRLWETFLYEKLDFKWDEVHEVAEQLEHIHSDKLIVKLDQYLGHPKVDPHGDPIPDNEGNIPFSMKKTLSKMEEGTNCKIISVLDNSAAFLQYVSELGMNLKTKIRIVSKQDFDNSMEIEVNSVVHRVSEKFTQNVFVMEI